MTTVIHRHKIPQTHQSFTLPLPDGARVVHVGWKGDDAARTVHLWEAHDTAASPAERTFRVVATGEPFDGAHVGTFVVGEFVWHVIETEAGR